VWRLVLGLAAGAALAVLVQPTVSPELTRFVVVLVIAAIDAALGGVRAALDRTFDDRIFVGAFLVNGAAAVLIVWLGDQLSTDLTQAMVVVFGIRIFQNLSAIRRRLLGG
jgi:small basic protein